MPLTDSDLAQIRELLETDQPVSARIGSIRAAFPKISLTRCDASDMDTETPALEFGNFNVFLIDTSEHCVRITTNPASATGVIIAERH
jgi:hypothetical protein